MSARSERAGGGGSRRVGVPASAAVALALVSTVPGVAAATAATAANAEAAAPSRTPDVPYEPSPPRVVEAMLDLARVKAGDVVYDLGCGDGRIVVAAARRGARAVGVDLDPRRIREARANAAAAGVLDRVELRVQDLFETDLSDATVVMLFLWPDVNQRLRPRLEAELRPGARVVSHWHDMGEWRPERTRRVAGRTIYLWRIPERRGGP